MKTARPIALRKLIRAVVSIGCLLCLPPSQAKPEGAFALGRDSSGRWWYGASVNELTARRASELAMARCQQQGPNCQLVKQFRLACFAIATPDTSNAAGTAMGGTKADAESRALTSCHQYSRGLRCAVRHSFCDNVDGPLTQTSMRLQQTEAEARREDLSRRQTSACSLSAKAITYAHRKCAANGQCDAKFGVIEIVGDSVLQYGGVQNASTGIQYRLGQTNDVTQDEAAIRKQLDGSLNRDGPTRQGEVSRAYATASYNGPTLTMHLRNITVTKNHRYFQDETLLSVMMMTTKFRINSCSSCAVTESGIVAQTFGGPVSLPETITNPISEQSCKIDSMR